MIIDITQGLSPGMAGFPGDAEYAEGWTFRLGPDCPVNVSRVSFSVHCGTHADAPLHYDAKGATAAALPLEPYIGPCRVIDARGNGPLCEPSDIAVALEGAPPRILLQLMDELDPKVWPTGFRAIAAETVELAAHHACRKANMRILENLALAHVEQGDYELIALPLKFENLDASPVRAVLRW